MKLLEKIVQRFHEIENIQHKVRLSPILSNIKQNGYQPDYIKASFGEDSAAITDPSLPDNYILVTTDAISEIFLKNSPWAAGFSAIYVGFEDIIAAGGKPIASSITLSIPENDEFEKSKKFQTSEKFENIEHSKKSQDFEENIKTKENEESGSSKEIMDGVLEATKKFQIPLIRGHTSFNATCYQLSSTIIGTCKKSDYISIKDTEIGDCIVLVFDKDGKPGKINRQYWNTILNANYERFIKKRAYLPVLKRKNLIHSCKDIANGGILGTTYQICEYSNNGAEISINKIKKLIDNLQLPYKIEDFVFAYLTSCFLLTIPQIYKDEVISIVNDIHGLVSNEIGKITQNSTIKLIYNNESKEINL